MKTHTSDFKNSIKQFGREIDFAISYGVHTLFGDDINSVSIHYEGGILKSVMKQLDLDVNVDIPVDTVINASFALKVNGEYEAIDYGDFIVYKSEKQEDTNSYKLTCYDRMLYAMKDYEKLNITYPITIRDYISAISTYMGVPFASSSDAFANYDRVIPAEIYLDADDNSLGYTFRDVLDELAEVTASTICINDLGELEVRYINNTGDTIDEEFLKDVNVNFGESYGPINTIVLSRSAGSDKVYISYPADLPDEEKNSIEIVDNQIMNFNDRADYLPAILNKLNGLEYYLNDFSSPGIMYYDLCDRYNIQVGENTYSCVMFNDEINVTQGLEENVHTDMPEETVTDYTKADKTDRRINQTYLIVDKQNQQIESVVSTVDEQNTKISQITQTVDEINSKISDIADITISGESSFATFTLDNINESEPIQIKVKPASSNISYIYPRSNLYPSSSLYSTIRAIRFHNNTTNENVDYTLPDDLLIYDQNTYDEFYLDYDSQTCQVTKRCKYNADGTVGLLSSERIMAYPYPTILLEDGDYTLSLLGYEYGYLFVRLMSKNIYTSQFYTKAETDSHINQKAAEIQLGVNQTLSNYSTTAEMNSAITITANQINSEVRQKVGNNEIISKINQTPETITINASKLNLQGYITATDLSGSGSTVINGSNITTGTINGNNVNVTNLNGSNITAGTINGNNVNITNLNASNITSGTISANKISGGTINASNISVTNLTASNITRGSLSGIPYTYSSSSNGSIKLGDNSDGPIMGYRGSSPRWSIAAFTAGGRFQTFDSSGNMAAYFNQTGAHTSSDIRYKDEIEEISEKTSLNIINKLTPISYIYKSGEKTRHRGLSAQEVEKVLNENKIENEIYEIDENGKYSLNYIELIPDLINCVKYLKKKVDDLERNDK